MFTNIPKNETGWSSLLHAPVEEEAIKEEAQLIMFRFLSEIQKFQDLHGMKRGDLAKAIGTSASYLTQVFRGDKPLNFLTLAKIQRVLQMRFEVGATSTSEAVDITDEGHWYQQVQRYHSGHGYWCYHNKHTGMQSDEIYNNPLPPHQELNQYDAEAIPA